MNQNFAVGDTVRSRLGHRWTGTVTKVLNGHFYNVQFDDVPHETFIDGYELELVHDVSTGKTYGAQETGVNPKDLVGVKKPPLHLVPTALNLYASQAMRNGAEKYGPFNWRTKPIIASVYVSAAKRHLDAWFDGEEVADDSKVEHLAHCVASLAILIDAIECGNVVDDRPPAGPAAKLIERFTQS